ncbi:hypothetical protein [Thalassolituus oleivorans]|uniref:hypothetical protein n=1 Tax=Thalassolituus oleivorans TaxID=187493 RepID=UPI001CE2DFEB|nr:hypothetical protein [Thalassolituus oleivorans]
MLADLANKGDWEKWIFCIALGFSFLHATVRSSPVVRGEKNPAWRDQCFIITALAITAVTANWLTTGDHLIKTIFTNPYWAVAGVDLSLLAVAATSWKAASRLQLKSIEKQESSSEAAYE